MADSLAASSSTEEAAPSAAVLPAELSHILSDAVIHLGSDVPRTPLRQQPLVPPGSPGAAGSTMVHCGQRGSVYVGEPGTPPKTPPIKPQQPAAPQRPADTALIRVYDD